MDPEKVLETYEELRDTHEGKSNEFIMNCLCKIY